MVTLKGKMIEIGSLEDGSGRGCKIESDGEEISITGMTEDECIKVAKWFGDEVEITISQHDALCIANDRAHRIATMESEELIRCEGTAPNHPDEVLIPQCQADDHMLDCIAHLVHAGEASARETDDGYIAVLFQDLTLSSLSSDDKGGA